MDTESLERRARQGDQLALAELFHIQRPRLRRVVASRLDTRLRGRVDPSDVLQEAFVDLSKKLTGYANRFADRPMSMFVWMRLVAVERVIHFHRAHLNAEVRDVQREVARLNANSATSLFLAEQFLAKCASAEHRLVKHELHQVLLKTLNEMEPLDHEVITMRFLEELTNAEVAESLGISKNAASNRFVRAMTRLRNDLDSIPGFVS